MPRVLHLTDTHFHAPGAITEHPQIDPADRLERVLDAVAARGFAPDRIGHTGDVADDSSTAAARAVRARLAPLAPVVAVPGNHDDPAAVRAVFGRAEAQVGAWHVTGIDTAISGDVAGQCVDLAAALARAAGPTLLLMHHPVRSHSTHPWFRLDEGERAVAALAASPHPLVVLSGHTHEVYDEVLAAGRVRLLGGPATFYPLRHRDDGWTITGQGTGAHLITLGDADSVVSEFLYA